MPKRFIETEMWGNDGWFEELSPNDKLLFIYSWSNPHVPPCGIYEITIKRISQETGLNTTQVQEGLSRLGKALLYSSEDRLLWVKNYARKQGSGQYWQRAIADSLYKVAVKHPLFAKLFIEHYQGFIQGLYKARPSLEEDLHKLLNIDIDISLKSFNTKDNTFNGKTEPENKPVKTGHGTYHNVMLTEDEYAKVEAEGLLPYIESLSLYMKSHGKRYTDYLATLRNWKRRETNKPAKQSAGAQTAANMLSILQEGE